MSNKLLSGWKIAKLGSLFDEVKVLIQPDDEDFKKLPFVGLEQIASNTREFLDVKAELPTSACFRFDSSHLLYGKLRPYLNKVYLPDSEGKSSMELIPFKVIGGYNREFLACALQSDAVIGDTIRFSTGGRMPRADLKRMKALSIVIPEDINVCNEIGFAIADKIKAISALHKVGMKQLKAIEALPAAILREAFAHPK